MNAAIGAFEGMRLCQPVSRPAAQLMQRCRAPQRACGHRMAVTARTTEVGVGLFGTKAGMTQIFTADGLAVPATVIALEEGNVVVQVKTPETDGYSSVQVGYRVASRENKLTKPELGHLKKHSAPALKNLREFKIKDGADAYTSGQQLIAAEMFKEGDLVDIAGKSIGKGFQGSIKRWGMKRGLMTHGSKSHRQHGSIGSSATPSRVLPGLHMAGHMGDKRVKVRQAVVMMVDMERGAIVVRGSVPGKPGNILEITPSKRVGKNC